MGTEGSQSQYAGDALHNNEAALVKMRAARAFTPFDLFRISVQFHNRIILTAALAGRMIPSSRQVRTGVKVPHGDRLAKQAALIRCN